MIGVLAACAVMASLLAGCGDNGGTPAAGGGPAGGGGKAGGAVRIAVIPKGTTDEFWKSIHAGAAKAQQEAQAAGKSVEIAWQGPVIENDSAKQISVVENMMNTGVQAMVLAPNDTNALAEVVDKAGRKFPVVIIDSRVNSENYKAFIATDNLKGGQLAGQEMVKLLGGKGRVIVLRHDKGQQSTEQREQGFIDVVTKAGITVVSSDQYGGPTGDTAYKAAENLLAGFKNPDNTLKADGIFASNESATYGMLRALQDVKQTGKVKFIGFDASQALVAGLKAGDVDGLVVQDPMNMGYLGVKTALEILDGKTPAADDRYIDTGCHIATKANMDSPEIKDLLYPPLDKYLK
jgi:ribose transport system substrate-binding protein